MEMLRSFLDHKRHGTHYSDRMHRILSVCKDCGILWHEERITYGNGMTEMRRIDDVEPAGSVLITPRHEKYGLRANPRVLPKLKKMASQFAYALNVTAAEVEIDGNVVYIRVPRTDERDEEIVTFQQAWSIAPDMTVGNVLLGIDDDHHQLVVELTSPTNVHAAVIGMTGSGKSTLMRTMILSAQMTGGAQVALFDPSDGFLPLSGHPSVWRGGLFRTPRDCERGLEALAQSIGHEKRGLTYVFVDEVPELVMQQAPIKDHLARLAQAGRHAGIHLVLGAQHPLSSHLGPITMRNVAVRLVGRVSDRTAAYNATGQSDTGAWKLLGKGDFLVVNGSRIRHFQAAIIREQTLHAWARRYPPRPPRVPVRPRAHSTKSQKREAGSGQGSGLPGRPPDPIPSQVILAIQDYVRDHGEPPSLNWVYRFTKETVPTGGFNRDKARRAIDMVTG
ncbi:MAG: FtsK/SpoIIIE domain-containing protein [Chloroflexota bacterium]|nr:FtsK/SpoIIIE domain-containing protein [Chloroflexota bacterium]